MTRDHYPDTNITVFYIDVRTPGKNFDEFYRRAVEQYGVHYIKGQVGKVTPLSDGTLDVQGSDLILNKQVHIKADMVVLAASIEADKSARPLATMLTTSMDNNDFFLEAHAKLRPVESPTAGIFLAGCCQGPKDIPETVAQSSGAAAKAICLLVKDKLKNNPCTAHPNENACNGCGQCQHSGSCHKDESRFLHIFNGIVFCQFLNFSRTVVVGPTVIGTPPLAVAYVVKYASVCFTDMPANNTTAASANPVTALRCLRILLNDFNNRFIPLPPISIQFHHIQNG